MLGFFKYYGFFEENVRALFEWIGLTPAWEPLRIFLPYGISFYTFQSLSLLDRGLPRPPARPSGAS